MVQAPISHVKAHVPDLQQLIALSTLVLAYPLANGRTPVTWDMLNSPILEEACVNTGCTEQYLVLKY